MRNRQGRHANESLLDPAADADIDDLSDDSASETEDGNEDEAIQVVTPPDAAASDVDERPWSAISLDGGGEHDGNLVDLSIKTPAPLKKKLPVPLKKKSLVAPLKNTSVALSKKTKTSLTLPKKKLAAPPKKKTPVAPAMKTLAALPKKQSVLPLTKQVSAASTSSTTKVSPSQFHSHHCAPSEGSSSKRKVNLFSWLFNEYLKSIYTLAFPWPPWANVYWKSAKKETSTSGSGRTAQKASQDHQSTKAQLVGSKTLQGLGCEDASSKHEILF